MDKKLLAMRKEEEEEKQRQNRLLEISQKIYSLQKLINDNEIQITHQEKELQTLQSQCNTLNIEAELQSSKIKYFRDSYKREANTLDMETAVLEKLHNNVWRPLEEFIAKSKPTAENQTELQTFIKVRRMQSEMLELKQENLKLEGEVCALEVYKKLLEKQIKKLKQIMLLLEKANLN